LKHFETELAGKVNNVFTLKGGMGKKQRRSTAEAIAAVPECEPRVILATGSYIGEGLRRRSLGYSLSGDAHFLEGNATAIRRASPPTS
jgi:hypothetical protein